MPVTLGPPRASFHGTTGPIRAGEFGYRPSGAIAELGQVTPDPLAYVDDETVELHRPIRPLGYGAPARPWDAPGAWVRWAPQGQADHR